MALLDIRTVQVCGVFSKASQALSSDGVTKYDVLVSLDGTLDKCGCPGWQFRKSCRHVDHARTTLCGWHSEASSVAQTLQQEVDMVCPGCGEETQMIRWGV